MIYLNGQKLDFEKFPNGETKVNGEQIVGLNNASNTVTLKYESDDDLIKLMFVKRYLDTISRHAYLRILYMPYSRMDRVEGNSVFTLKYASEFINSLKFDRIYVLEPHSDVTTALLNNAVAKHTTVSLLAKTIKEVGFCDYNEDYLFFPDAGAQKRYSMFKYPSLVGYKSRDFQTGRINGLEVVGNAKPGFKAIIVDDLCSYGGTFILSAQRLKEMGASEIYLVVTHCENSIFKGDVFKKDNLINKVFTSDSILSDEINCRMYTATGQLHIENIDYFGW